MMVTTLPSLSWIAFRRSDGTGAAAAATATKSAGERRIEVEVERFQVV